MTAPPTADRPDPFDSPTLLLSTLFSARRSGDVVLERLAARRLAEIGIMVQFADARPGPARRDGVTHAG